MTVDDLLRQAARDLLEGTRSDIDPDAALERVTNRRRPRRTQWLVVAAALVAAVGVAAALVVTADDGGEPVTSGSPTTTVPSSAAMAGVGPGESEGVPMTATPSTGLSEGDTVDVIAEGLDPDSLVMVVMCRGDALDSGQAHLGCELDATGELTPSAEGVVETSIVVERLVSPDPERTIDCASEGARCAIGVVVQIPQEEVSGEPNSSYFTLEVAGLVGVAFSPLEPLDEPSFTVEPSGGLVHGQTVTLTGEGFDSSVTTAELCTPSSDSGQRCTNVSLVDPETMEAKAQPDENGRFEVEVSIWRAFPTFEDTPPEIVDCALANCTLRLVGDDGQAAAPVRLDFDASTPTPQPPSLAVTPTTGLRPGDPVMVTATGLAPGLEVVLLACDTTDPEFQGRCGTSTSIAPATAGADGVLTATVPAIDPAQYGVDCTEAGSCAVSLDDRDRPFSSHDPLIRAIQPAPVQYAP